jgi:hypothetical protein
VGCECGLMAELGREMGTSSEKVEEIALVAVDGLFAMVTRQCLVVGSEGRSFGVSYLRRASRPFGEGGSQRRRYRRISEKHWSDRFNVE